MSDDTIPSGKAGSMSDLSYITRHEGNNPRPDQQEHEDRFGWVEARDGRGTYPDGWVIIIDRDMGGAIAAFASMEAGQSYYDWLVSTDG